MATSSFGASLPAVVEPLSALDQVRANQESAASITKIVPGQGAILVGPAIVTDTDGRFPSQHIGLTVSPPPGTHPRIECSQQLARAAIGVDADSELGTQAIPVDTTRFDDRWARVRRAPAPSLMQVQLKRAAVMKGLGEAAMFDRINLWVNRQIAYADDERNYRQRDFWATADETVSRGSGDCEDFAILKMHMLRAAGIDDDRMKLVLLRDLAINADHAFLLVRSKAGWVVLDNMTDQIYDGRQSDAMRPILSFSGNRRWIHGYRDAPAPAASATGKASAIAFASGAPAAISRTSFKTALVRDMSVRRTLARLSIGYELTKMLERLPPRGAK
ncbi:transglutaminase-like cysteine peptidase [Sphingopyxis sp.]|uniref:transglutaminase-like cysteine peptidase n=1 Tax=Sphingopyxis sp. TaxID=1908224 RepID=UPI001D434B8B|nr:transglutaminase-like cysteine peptidase [Sphingopyxis sp.]MBW8296497.1 transglutaminase-like cysteine peptidase [Sphingopyxis sp.]